MVMIAIAFKLALFVSVSVPPFYRRVIETKGVGGPAKTAKCEDALLTNDCDLRLTRSARMPKQLFASNTVTI